MRCMPSWEVRLVSLGISSTNWCGGAIPRPRLAAPSLLPSLVPSFQPTHPPAHAPAGGSEAALRCGQAAEGVASLLSDPARGLEVDTLFAKHAVRWCDWVAWRGREWLV